MCRGKAPSCGVHSLFIRHYVPLRAPAVHGFDWYAPGCHACDALADEYGAPEALNVSVTWNGERPEGGEAMSGTKHGMVPGSHERASGPYCRCGEGWSLWQDMCAAQWRESHARTGLAEQGSADGS